MGHSQKEMRWDQILGLGCFAALWLSKNVTLEEDAQHVNTSSYKDGSTIRGANGCEPAPCGLLWVMNRNTMELSHLLYMFKSISLLFRGEEKYFGDLCVCSESVQHKEKQVISHYSCDCSRMLQRSHLHSFSTPHTRKKMPTYYHFLGKKYIAVNSFTLLSMIYCSTVPGRVHMNS